MIKVDNMERLLVQCTICILLLVPLISSGCIDEENSNDDINEYEVYNESNFIQFKTENKSLLRGRKADFGSDKIVYLARNNLSESAVPGIWVMNIDGSNRTIVYANNTIDKTFTPPKFSPDGEKILFVSYYGHKEREKIETSIDILIKNGTEWDSNCTHEQIYRINKTIGRVKESCFNHDGSKIVYELYGPIANPGDIYIMDSDGTSHKRLTTHKGMDKQPAFSPDSSKIVWIHSDSGPDPEYLWIMNSDGSDKKCITKDLNYCSWPTFTPNGKILFECDRPSPHSNKLDTGNIWIMDADGSNQTLIVPTTFGGNTFSTEPAISPDGTMIVFFHGLINNTGLWYIKDPDGDGIWEDSDGDGVADVCDGAPNDPDEGYIKGNDSDDDFICSIIFISGILIASVAIFLKKKN